MSKKRIRFVFGYLFLSQASPPPGKRIAQS